MYYLKNDEKNGIELYFDRMPNEEIRHHLKSTGWRWFKAKKCWYNKYSAENENLAKLICDGKDFQKATIAENRKNNTVSAVRIPPRKKIVNARGLFAEYEDCLSNRIKLRGILSDIFLGDKLHVNVIIAAYDMGIVESIESAKEINDIFKGKCCKKLVAEFGLSEENALYAVNYWLREYAGLYLGKKIKCSLENDTDA